MKRTISVFGLGYVGSVTAACLAHKGHRVIGVDPNLTKVNNLNAGRTPIIEARMDELLAEAQRSGLVSATDNPAEAIANTEVSFISVGTPNQRNGSLDLRHVLDVAGQIGAALRHKNSFHCIVLRSTVLPGTTESVLVPAIEAASSKVAGRDFAVCFNPEFLREGTAVDDFFHPPFTVLGANDPAFLATLREIYDWGKTFETSIATAEMVKYVCNAFHAVKVGFANEIGTLCTELGVDPQLVTDIFVSDTVLNISKAYLTPGFAFGGSCLPKDLRALTYRARQLDLKLPLLESILPSNAEHIQRATEAVLATGKRKIGVLGLSFKPGTDDLRESPMVHLVKRLLGEGCQISIWDKSVSLGQLIGSNREFIEQTIPHIGSLLCAEMKDVIRDAEVVLIGSKAVDKIAIQASLTSGQVMIDVVRLEPRPCAVGAARA